MVSIAVVVDTSVIMKWLSADHEGHLDQANALLADIQAGHVEIFAPELAKYEVGNVLLLGKHLSIKQDAAVLAVLTSLPITFFGESPELAADTFALASRLGITYYDAAFLALARQQGAVLITANPKHQYSTESIRVVSLAAYSIGGLNDSKPEK